MKILIGVLVLVVVGVVLVPLSVHAACTGSSPNLSAATAADLASCITASVCGDTITLTAGTTYTLGSGAQFTLSNKGDCSANPITIKSNGTLPSSVTDCADPGPTFKTYLCPSRDAGQLAKIVSDPGGSRIAAFQTSDGANGWTLRGLEITDPGSNGAASTTVLVSFTNSGTYSAATTTQNITLDLSWVHPAVIAVSGGNHDVTAEIGINMGSQNMTITRNYISGFGGYYPTSTTRNNSYGILAASGGPTTINDNYISALFNNIFIVGSTVNPNREATISAPTSTSATLSSTTDLQVGDYIALEVDNAELLNRSDFTTSGAGATHISCTTTPCGFTAGMLGRVIWFSAGTNFVTGEHTGTNGYIINAVNSTDDITVNRSPSPSAAGSGGVATIRNCHDQSGGGFSTCYQSGKIATVNSGTGAITWTPIGPEQCQNSLTFWGACASNQAPKNGGDAHWRGLLPHDYTVKRNVMFKPLFWQVDFSGGVKDYVEIKALQTATFQGNIMAGACSAGITPEVAVGPKNNGAPWTQSTALLVRDNLFLANVASPGWIVNNSEQTNMPPTSMQYINNLLTAAPAYCPPKGSSGEHAIDSGFIATGSPAATIEWSHNTFRLALDNGIYQNDVIKGSTTLGGMDSSIFRDNIFDFSAYGLNTPTVRSDPAQNPILPNFTEDHNVINDRIGHQVGRDPCYGGAEISGDASHVKQFPNSCATSPTGLAANDAAIKFANSTACDDGSDYHGCGLASDSQYKNKASDGTDPGVNLTLLDAQLPGGGGTPPPPPATPPGHKFKMKRH